MRLGLGGSKGEALAAVRTVNPRRLYPRPNATRVSRENVQKGKSSMIKSFEDRLIATSQILETPLLPDHLFTQSATGTTIGQSRSLFFAKQSLCAIFFLNKLQVYSVEGCTRLFEYIFEGDKNHMWFISDVSECSLPLIHGQSSKDTFESGLLVSVSKGDGNGALYWIDPLTASTKFIIHIPFEISKVFPSWTINNHYHATHRQTMLFDKFRFPLFIGTVSGRLIVMDLAVDVSFGVPSTLRYEETINNVGLSAYDPILWNSQRRGLTHPWLDINFASFPQPEYFEYLNPVDGAFVGTKTSATHLDADSVRVTSMCVLWPSSPPKSHNSTSESSQQSNQNNTFSPELQFNLPYLNTPLLVVGFNFGCFQIWSLSSLKLLYCSPFGEAKATITHFCTQSLASIYSNEPTLKYKFLLWVGRGSISNLHCNQAHEVSLSCYSFDLKVLEHSRSSIRDFNTTQIIQSSLDPKRRAVSSDDCFMSVEREFLQSLGSQRLDLGRILHLSLLPCWERPELSLLSVCFVWDTFSSQNTVLEHTTQCRMLSLPEITYRGSDSSSTILFPGRGGELFSKNSINYPLDPIVSEQPILLSIDIDPRSVQHFLPSQTDLIDSTSTSGSSSMVYLARLSADVIAVTDDSIWRVSYASSGKQLLHAIADKGPLAFENPGEALGELLEYSGHAIPDQNDESSLEATRAILFSLALNNNLASAITDYILNMYQSDRTTAMLYQVFTWATSTYKHCWYDAQLLSEQLCQKSSVSSTKTQGVLNKDDESQVGRLRDYKQLLGDIYQILLALQGRYLSQVSTFEVAEAVLKEHLDAVLIATQYIQLSIWLIESQLFSHVDFKTFSNLVNQRRARAKEILSNSSSCYVFSGDGSFSMQKIDPFDEQQDEGERSSIAPLIIDQIINDCTMNELEKQTNPQQVEKFVYPPSQIFDILKHFRTGSPEETYSKYRIVYYWLCDVAPDLCNSFCVSMHWRFVDAKLIRALHALDAAFGEQAVEHSRGALQHAASLLSDPQVVSILTSQQNEVLSEMVLRFLVEGSEVHGALSFYNTCKPKVTTLQSKILRLQLLLSNGLITEAFNFIRNYSINSNSESNVMDTLYAHFFSHCSVNNVLNDIFQLPLNDIEMNTLQRWLEATQSEEKAADLYLISQLMRSKILESFQMYQNQISTIQPTSRESLVFKSALLNNYRLLLPPVIRRQIPQASSNSSLLSHPAAQSNMRNIPSNVNNIVPAKSFESSAPSGRPLPGSAFHAAMSSQFDNSQQQSQKQKQQIPLTPKSKMFATISSPVRQVTSTYLQLPPTVLTPTRIPHTSKTTTTPIIFKPTVVAPTASTPSQTSGDLMSVDSTTLQQKQQQEEIKSATPIYTQINVLSGDDSIVVLPPNNPPPIVSQDSLVHSEDDDEIELISMSTPTKKVMERVVQHAEESIRLSKVHEDDFEGVFIDEENHEEEEEEHEEEEEEHEEDEVEEIKKDDDMDVNESLPLQKQQKAEPVEINEDSDEENDDDVSSIASRTRTSRQSSRIQSKQSSRDVSMNIEDDVEHEATDALSDTSSIASRRSTRSTRSNASNLSRPSTSKSRQSSLSSRRSERHQRAKATSSSATRLPTLPETEISEDLMSSSGVSSLRSSRRSSAAATPVILHTSSSRPRRAAASKAESFLNAEVLHSTSRRSGRSSLNQSVAEEQPSSTQDENMDLSQSQDNPENPELQEESKSDLNIVTPARRSSRLASDTPKRTPLPRKAVTDNKSLSLKSKAPRKK